MRPPMQMSRGEKVFAALAVLLLAGATFAFSDVIIGGGPTASQIRFMEPSGSGTNYTAMQAQAQGSNITYTLPSTVGGPNTFLRDSAGNGTLDWATGPVGPTGPTGATGATGAGGSLGYYGSFYDTNATQTLAAANVSTTLLVNSTSEQNGVTLSSNAMVFSNPGTYSITISVQFVNTSNQIYDAALWLRKNGTALTYTNSYLTVPNSHGNVEGKMLGTVNYVLTLAAADSITFEWTAQNTSVKVETVPVDGGIPSAPGVILTAQQIMYTQLSTTTNCTSSASPAVCSSAAAGAVAVPDGSTTLTVNTTAVTANSDVSVTFDSSLGTRLGVTCNTVYTAPWVTAKTAGTSFQVTIAADPSGANPACLSYVIVN